MASKVSQILAVIEGSHVMPSPLAGYHAAPKASRRPLNDT